MQEANQEKGENNEIYQASRSSITQPNGAKLLGIKESKSEVLNTNDKESSSSKNLLTSNQKQRENNEKKGQDKVKQVTNNSASNNHRASLNNGLAIQVNSEEIDPSKSLDKCNSSKTNPASGLHSFSDRKDEICFSRNIDLDEDRFHQTKQIEPLNYNFLSPDVSNDGRCSRSYSQNDITSDRIASTKDDESVRSLNLRADQGITMDGGKRTRLIRMSSFNVKPPPGRAAHCVVGAR